jgi:hypothetical protein
MLQFFYLDLTVCHGKAFAKCNKLILILFDKQTQDVAKVCYKFCVLMFFDDVL